nr:hypothetical protein [uncultured Campylobacter sp.]
MGYLRLAKFRMSQNRGEIPRAVKAHKSVAAISQASPSQKPIPRDEQYKYAMQGGQRTTDAIRRTDDARQAMQIGKRAPGYRAPTSLKFALS